MRPFKHGAAAAAHASCLLPAGSRARLRPHSPGQLAGLRASDRHPVRQAGRRVAAAGVATPPGPCSSGSSASPHRTRLRGDTNPASCRRRWSRTAAQGRRHAGQRRLEGRARSSPSCKGEANLVTEPNGVRNACPAAAGNGRPWTLISGAVKGVAKKYSQDRGAPTSRLRPPPARRPRPARLHRRRRRGHRTPAAARPVRPDQPDGLRGRRARTTGPCATSTRARPSRCARGCSSSSAAARWPHSGSQRASRPPPAPPERPPPERCGRRRGRGRWRWRRWWGRGEGGAGRCRADRHGVGAGQRHHGDLARLRRERDVHRRTAACCGPRAARRGGVRRSTPRPPATAGSGQATPTLNTAGARPPDPQNLDGRRVFHHHARAEHPPCRRARSPPSPAGAARAPA
ncbi:hypothetical protein SALBM135S_06091 [Streptomyces alboniger]